MLHFLLAKKTRDLLQNAGFQKIIYSTIKNLGSCLLYTSDAADERSSVDLGGRRIIKKKKQIKPSDSMLVKQK